jgi:hypothetical protein
MKTVIKYSGTKEAKLMVALHDCSNYLGYAKFESLTTYLSNCYQRVGIRKTYRSCYVLCGIAGIEGKYPIRALIAHSIKLSRGEVCPQLQFTSTCGSSRSPLDKLI